jgi:hypothetical protein
MSKSTQLCVITTICGKNFKYLYPAPTQYNCYVFTNNAGLQPEAAKKGWICILFSKLKPPSDRINLTLTDDFVISSIQSKYVKFLQILRDNPQLNLWKYQQILYIDHKLHLHNHHIIKLQRLKNPSKGIVIRKTPRLKMSVWDEFKDALGQPRYRQFERPTRAFINAKVAQGYQSKVRVCNTGLILYDLSSKPHRDQIIKLTREVYTNIRQVSTPECQIIWAMIAQKYSPLIQNIESSDVNIPRKTPTN